jgi:hypothetical protein
MSLPRTVTARRNARLRAAALATIPLILFVVAALPRVWAPDLVPFSGRQVDYVQQAADHQPVSLLEIYRDRTLPALALVEPLLRDLPSPVSAWVVVRGLIDAVGVGLLFLAARPLVGAFSATLAALLYASSPAAWAAARDPAGPFGPFAMSAALLVGVRLCARPTMTRGLVFGVVLGLLARSLPFGLLVVPLGAAGLAVGRASWRVGGITALGLVLTAGPALFDGRSLLAFDLIWSFDALQLPAWLISGTAYRVQEGHAVGTMLPSAYEAQFAVLTLILVVAGVALTMQDARRGRPGALLILVWAVCSWIGALGVIDHVMLFSGGQQTTPMLNATATVVALPPLVMFMSLSTATRMWAVRWTAVSLVLVLFAVELSTVGLSLRGVEKEAASGNAFRGDRSQWRLGRDFNAVWPEEPGTETWALLREWEVLADAAREAVARAGADEILVAGDVRTSVRARPLVTLLRGQIAVRRVAPSIVLPLERETVFIVSIVARDIVEPGRAASTIAVTTDSGVDTGARIITLRPRSATDWLARTRTIPDGGFVDGTSLVGVGISRLNERQTEVLLYWSLATTETGDPIGEIVRVSVEDNPMTLAESGGLFPRTSRRSGELSVQRILLVAPPVELRGLGPIPDPVLRIGLEDRTFRPIRTTGGSDSIEVPLGAPQR